MTIHRAKRRPDLALILLILVSLSLVACAAQPITPLPPEDPVRTTASRSITVRTAATPATGLPIEISQGAEQPPAQEHVARATAEPLTAAQMQAVLNRLQPLPVSPGDAQVFAFPSAPLPPPRPGQTINIPFPPPTTVPPPVVAASAVEVLRYAPEGDVPLAPNLSVTFNQPMVALTGLSDLAAQSVPVKLSPQPAGKWRWIGTKTLAFEPQATEATGTARFPMATKYTVEIPAGTISAGGGTLTKTVTWTFTTPPPQVQASYPNDGPHPLEPVMFVAFDQGIDPAAVLEKVEVKAKAEAKEQTLTVRPATADEIESDKAVSRLAKAAGAGRWLAFRAEEPLPPDALISVTIGADTTSAEGPLTTPAAQGFTFRTYGPLRVTRSYCAWGSECPPMTPWYIEFSNPLDEAAFDATQVRIEPELPGAQIQVYGNTLNIQGRSAGRTTYTVRLAGSIGDIYGQSLGSDQVLTFKVGAAQPNLWAPGDVLVTLDPSAKKPVFSVFTINYDRLKVRAYAVQPGDWPAFKSYLRDYYRTDRPPEPPGRRVLSETVRVASRPDEMVETAIDLAPALQDGLGHVVLIVEPVTSILTRRGQTPMIQKWVQATRIGLDAFVDGENLIAWGNALTDGAPLPGVKLALVPGDRPASADATGVATLLLPYGPAAALLTGTSGNDTAILPADPYFWGDGGWTRRPATDSLRWYVFDDRGLYRPGEDVHVKGWIRRVGGGPTGDIGPLAGAVAGVSYRLRDSQGNELAQGNADLTGLGGFDLTFTLAENMNLGTAYLELNATGGSGGVDNTGYGHPIPVQEFRRPEFEVKATAGEGPFFAGGSAPLEVKASYYAGGPLPDAETTWRVTSQPGHFSPPGWDDFTFGRWIPWWREWGDEGGWKEPTVYTGRTDSAGVHRVQLDFGKPTPSEPTAVTAEATVMDVNRQAWTSTVNLLVHPADLYVGLRSDRLFVEREQPLKIDLIVTDLDGKPVPGREIKARAARMDWSYKDGRWQEEEAAVQPCIVQSGTEPVRCTFETPEGGTYRIAATVTDEQDRPNRSEITVWVSGGQRPPAREVEQEEVTLIPDKRDYQPGDTAEILVQAPFYPAEGLVTLRRSGIVRSERITMDGPTYTLRVPVEEAFIPNVHVQVDLVGAAPRLNDAGELLPDAPKRPAYATGELNLKVPPLARTLALEVSPRDLKLEPGGKTTVDVTLRDAQGKPVEGAEVAVVVVDEAVLALTNYDPADPVSIFYAERSPDVSDYHTRSQIVLASPDDLMAAGQEGAANARALGASAPAATMAPAPMAEMKDAAFAAEAPPGAGAAGPAIALRTDFNPLAAFAPVVRTDAQGRGQVEVKLPDNLTRYRVIAVAVAGGKAFGKGESTITARLPLMVRPSPPRFLNFGDRFELPVVLQNQTDTAMTVDVVVRGTNIALCQTFEVCETSKVSGSTVSELGQRVIVPADDRIEVRFPAETVSAGTARFQIAAAQQPGISQRPPGSDAAQFELPVWTPATTEAFAVYGELDKGAVAQPVIAPSNVFTQFGGLEISTSSTALQALTDAVLYLVAYPFECSEQLASRILAVAALRDVMTAFQAEGLPPPKEIDAAVARDIARLQTMQNDDGGWPMWRRGEASWPYHSIHAANALERAKQKGYDVPQGTLDKALDYLRNIERTYPAEYSQDVRQTLTAYALNVRKQMGDADPARARSLIQEAGLEKLPLEAVGWLLPVLSDDPGSTADVAAIRRLLLNRATETAGTAHFATSYGDNGYLLLHSDRRVDGIILEALIGDQPESDLIPKIVRGLLAHRTAGHWTNTQENVFILLALDRYFNTYEAQTPDFVARIWLGDQYAGEATFRGRTTDYQQIDVPMSVVAAQPGAQDLILSKEGPGRLYYRLGLRYAPTDLKLPPYDAGFTVERTYEAVDDPADVQRDADGAWRIKAGARVRVKLTMVAPTRRYHVALVDPLPAGLEALNPALAVTGSLPGDSGAGQKPAPYWWWWGPWYQHENLRDERIEAFTPLLWDGVWRYDYIARATTPGVFVVPPTKAEEMYAPETFGRGAADRVIVE